MPNFDVGGIEATVTPSFEGFSRRARQGLSEEEARLPNLRVPVEPRFTAEFRRELVRQIRESSAGVRVEVEATANVTRAFRTELVRQVREASAGVRVDVEATPVLSKGFKADLVAKVREASAGVTIDVEVTPKLGRDFKTKLRSLIAEATAGVRFDVEVNPALGKGFRTELRSLVKKSSSKLDIKVPVNPELAKGFAKRVKADAEKALARTYVNVEVRPQLAKNFRSRLRTLAKSQTGEFPVTVVLKPESTREIRSKLLLAIKQATEEPPLVARVRIVPLVERLRADVQGAVKKVNLSSSSFALKPGVDGGHVLGELSSKVKSAVGRVTKLARIPVSLATEAFSKGISFMESALGKVRRLAVLGATGIGVLSVAVLGAGAAGVKSAGDFELQRKSLELLLQSAGKGDELFQGLLQQAKETPFQVPDLSPLLRQFVVIRNTLGDEKAFGFQDLLPSVKTVSDLEAELGATGTQAQRLGFALAKVAGRGKLTAEELRSITKNAPGFSAIQVIADKLGVTVPEAFKKVTAGEVPATFAINTILEGMKKFPGAAGAAAKQAKETFKGALSNFPDIVRIAFFGAFDTELPRLTKLIGVDGPLAKAAEAGANAVAKPFTNLAVGLGDFLLDLAKNIGPLVQAVVGEATDLLEIIKPLLPTLALLFTVIRDVGVALKPALDAISLFLSAGLNAALFASIGPLTDLAKTFGDILVALGPFFEVLVKLVPQVALFVGQLSEALLPIAKALASGLTPVVAVLQDMLFSFGLLIAQSGPVLAQFVTGLLGGILNIGKALLPILPVLATTLGKMLDIVAPTLPVLGQVIGLIASAAAQLLAAAAPSVVKFLAVLVDALPPIAKALGPVAGALGTLFATILTNLSPLLPPIGRLIAMIGRALVPIIGDLTKAFSIALPVVVSVLKQVGAPLLKGLVSFFVQLVKAGLPLAPLFLQLFKAVAPVLVLLANALGGQEGRLGKVFSALVGSVIELVKAIAPLVPAFVKALLPVLTVIAGIAPKVTPSIVKLARAFGEQLAPKLGDLVDKIVPVLVQQGPRMAEVFTEFLAALIPLLPPLTELAISLLPIMVQFLPVLTTLLTAMTPILIGSADAMSLLAAQAASAAGFVSLIIGWVARAAAMFFRFGDAVVGGLLRGLGRGLGDITGFFSRLFTDVIDFVKRILGIHSPSTVFADIAHDIISGFIGGLGGFEARVVAKLEDVAKAIVGWIAGLPGRAASALKTVADMGASIGGGILGGIKNAITGAGHIAGDIAGAVWSHIAGFINDHLISPIKNKSIFGGHPFGFLPLLPTKLAEGGIFNRPTLALIAEAGPEAVIPLKDRARMLELLRQAGVLGAGGSAKVGVGLDLQANVKGAKDFTQRSADAVADLGAKLTGATQPGLNAWRRSMGAHFDGLLVRLGQFRNQARMSVQATTADMRTVAVTGSAQVVGALRTGLDHGTATVATIVRGYARNLASGLNPVLTAIGQPAINLKQFRRGGIDDPRIVPDGSYNVHVFGERGTKGEAYIPFDPSLRSSSRAIADETVRRLGGHATWFRGGGVTGDTVGLNAEFLRRLDRWSNAVGSGYRVDSGYRSFDEQKRLYQRYLAGVPGQAKAAPPGTSMHNFGLASDGNRWRSLNPGAFGLRYPMGFEPWHVEPVEARQWARMMSPDAGFAIVPLPKPGSAGRFGQLSITGKKAMAFTYQQALAWAGAQGFSGAPGTLGLSGSGGNEAAAARWTAAAIALTGVPTTWLSRLLTLERRESGFDPRAINRWDANARAGFPTEGIGQMRADTFRRYALPGHTDIWNPVDNLAAVIRYIQAVYGDVSHVQQANATLPPRGYADGAIVSHEHMARVAEKNKPEVIIPLTNPARAMALAEASGVARMVRGQAYGGPKTVIEKLEVKVEPPAAASPEAYASSVSHRMESAIATALDKVLP